MTEPEIILWSKIKNKQIKSCIFYRQKPIGDYIVDFVCLSEKLVIELDGLGHYHDGGPEADKKRDEYLTSKGFRVLRFDNAAIYKHLDGVINIIRGNIKKEEKRAG